jgi:hypothetical protein
MKKVIKVSMVDILNTVGCSFCWNSFSLAKTPYLPNDMTGVLQHITIPRIASRVVVN